MFKTIEKRQGLTIACMEEITYLMGYINPEQVRHNTWPDLCRKPAMAGIYFK